MSKMKEEETATDVENSLSPGHHYHSKTTLDCASNCIPKEKRAVCSQVAEINLLANTLLSRLYKTEHLGMERILHSASPPGSANDQDARRTNASETIPERSSMKSVLQNYLLTDVRHSILKSKDTNIADETGSSSTSMLNDDHSKPCHLMRPSREIEQTSMGSTGLTCFYGEIIREPRIPDSKDRARFVKLAGVFQPMDKYATRRRSLHGDDIPFAKHAPVTYGIVTLPDRYVPESDDVTVWSLSRSHKRKGLQVSWTGTSDDLDKSSYQEEMVSSVQTGNQTRSVGGKTRISWQKPTFSRAKSQESSLGIEWNIPIPKTSIPENTFSGGGSVPSKTLGSKYFHSPSSTRLTAHKLWRTRNVHPVTSAMEREGISVSKTKWRVPNTRTASAFAYRYDTKCIGGLQTKYCMRQNFGMARSANESIMVRYNETNRDSNKMSA